MSRTIEGQAVIIDCGRWNNHLLNEVGTRVWNLIDGRRSVEEITVAVRQQLVEEGFESVPPSVEKDVEDFLTEVTTMGIVTMEQPEAQG